MLGSFLEAFVGYLPSETVAQMRVVVVVLPLLELGVERSGVVDDDAFEESVELDCLDAVAAFDLAVTRGVQG